VINLLIFIGSESTDEFSERAPPRAIRARDVRAADLQKEPTKRVTRKADSPTQHRFVGSDEDGGFPANIAASEASHWTQRASASGTIKLGSRCHLLPKSGHERHQGRRFLCRL